MISAYSSSIFWRSRRARRRNCMSRTAWAWRALRAKGRAIRRSFACSADWALRMVWITWSRFWIALISPSRMCPRSRAFCRSNSERRVGRPRPAAPPPVAPRRLLDPRPRLHHDAPAAVAVGLLDAVSEHLAALALGVVLVVAMHAVDDAAGGEVRPLDDLRYLF